MSKKDKLIAELEDDVQSLNRMNDLLNDRILQLTKNMYSTTPSPPKQEKKEYGGSVCFDYWPPTDWFRLGNTSQWSRSRYYQFCIGPLRFEFYEV